MIIHGDIMETNIKKELKELSQTLTQWNEKLEQLIAQLKQMRGE